jgi:hypothetical protein
VHPRVDRALIEAVRAALGGALGGAV